MTFEQYLVAALVTLSGVVAYLFRDIEKTRATAEKRSDECEQDRRELWKHIYKLEGKGCDVSNCELRKYTPIERPPMLAAPGMTLGSA